jgi:hypothetical protein
MTQIDVVAYPISEEDGPVVASATPLNEPEIVLVGLIHATPETNDVEFNVTDAARSISWNDPFYANDPDIIAAFHFNSNDLREIYVGREWFGWFMLIVWILVGIFLSFATKIGWNCWWFFWLPVVMSIGSIADAKKEIFMLERRHVAVARSGVYLDETDEPGSASLARRTIIKFESIVSCRIKEAGCARPLYSVVIRTPYTTTTKPSTPASAKADPEYIAHTVTGLSNGQAFVDLVSAMMKRAKRAKRASANTGS